VPSPDPSARIAVAYITGAKGVRGQVRAQLLTHGPERFAGLGEIVVQQQGRPDRRLRLEGWRAQARGVLLKFAGIDAPEQARDLVGGYVTIAPEQLALLPADTYYAFDLVGCTAFDEAGQCLGIIDEVLHLPTTDAYVVRRAGREFLLPAVGDFVVSISTSAKRVVVRGVQELLESP
jgi:16S rRNA processing protein RimM